VRFCWTLLLAVTTLASISGAQTTPSAENPREQKALDKAKKDELAHHDADAIDAYREANKIAAGGCVTCLTHLSTLYRQTGDYKKSAEAAAQLEQIVTTPQDKSAAAILQGAALLRDATNHKKSALFMKADAQFKQALQLDPEATEALFFDGVTLGRMGDDAAAHVAFTRYLASKNSNSVTQARARRYLENPELVRERMAPYFTLETMRGKVVNLDALQGKVVLLDFWATWCGPCVAELPHLQRLEEQFQGKPFVVLSISVDHDAAKWQTFVQQHNMTWLQYRDGDGGLTTTFAVKVIPNYFTIDSDGVLRADQLGGEGIDGRLKKLVDAAETREQKTGLSSNTGNH
jgi:thiol-disulfide isomerase/thioredoxin